MPFPYDEDFRDEDSGVFDGDERPTVAEGRRRRREQRDKEANDPDFKLGRIIIEMIKLRRDVDFLLENQSIAPHRSKSIFHRPPFQSATISAIAAIIVAILARIADKIGLIP